MESKESLGRMPMLIIDSFDTQKNSINWAVHFEETKSILIKILLTNRLL